MTIWKWFEKLLKAIAKALGWPKSNKLRRITLRLRTVDTSFHGEEVTHAC